MRLKYIFTAALATALCFNLASPLHADEQKAAASPAVSASENGAASTATASGTAGTAEGQAAEDGKKVLAPIKEGLVSPEQQVVSTELKPKTTRFTLLVSDDPNDYKRKQGIWISDSGNGRIIYMKDLNGNDFYSLGSAGRDIGNFLNPEQVWVDIEGKLYIADRDNNRIVRVDDLRGYNWTVKEGFNAPRGVAMHGKRFIVSDTGNNRIL
ncbi:hypothetical protein IJT17_06355, partial [bacterium]|nr:hypothetical protein [bacterium]